MRPGESGAGEPGKYFDALVTAAPDRGSSDVVLLAEGDTVVEQARYTGTHNRYVAEP